MLERRQRAHAARMRSLFAVALVACVPYEPASTYVPVADDAMTCHLMPQYDGKLSYTGVTNITTLTCTAKNAGTFPREICAQPYVGVRETGALYTSHGPACSDELASNEMSPLLVQLDMRRELCQLDRGGCVVHVVPLGRDGKPDSEEVVALAHALEREARAPGRDRPSLAECDALLASWTGNRQFTKYTPYLAHRDDMRVFCLGLNRAELACLRAASTSADADKCAP